MGTTNIDKLRELKQMLDNGTITPAEFEQMKQSLLDDAKSLPQRSVETPHKKNNWVIPVIVVGVIIIGGGGYFAATHTHMSGNQSTSEVKRSSAIATSKKDSSSTKTKSSSQQNQSSTPDDTKTSDVTPGWSSAKLADLSNFMSQWEMTMGQQYQGTYDNQVVDRLGYTFLNMIQNGKLDGKIALNGTVTDVVWDADGKSSGDYQAVAFASGTISGQMYPTSYLFVIDHGNPVVYVTQTTNGDVLYFTPTENNDLQSGFENVMSGQSATVTTDSDSGDTADAENPVDVYLDQHPEVVKVDGLLYDNARYGLGFTADEIHNTKAYSYVDYDWLKQELETYLENYSND